MIPGHSRYVIVGAGIHGLSTAWHLAGELRRRGLGGGEDILVLDKRGVGAGASGIACGVIRNNYFQPAMRELMAHSVTVWESDPDAFAYHPVGYLQIAPEAMHKDVAKIFAEQQAIGYPSVLVEGSATAARTCWRCSATGGRPAPRRSCTSSGAATPTTSARCAAWPPRPRPRGCGSPPASPSPGSHTSGGAVTAVETDQGVIGCEQLVIAAGPWVRDLWAMLGLPSHIPVTTPDGTVHDDQPMWTYWALQEGTLAVDPSEFTTNEGAPPPVRARRLRRPALRRPHR